MYGKLGWIEPEEAWSSLNLETFAKGEFSNHYRLRRKALKIVFWNLILNKTITKTFPRGWPFLLKFKVVRFSHTFENSHKKVKIMYLCSCNFFFYYVRKIIGKKPKVYFFPKLNHLKVSDFKYRRAQFFFSVSRVDTPFDFTF